MPELKPLPCPYCGTEEIECWDGPANFMECQYCHMTGPHAPSGYSAIDLWNALPRALTWTTEPPTVVGKFWWRDKRHPNEACVINVTQTKLDGYRRHTIGVYEQFAGPIPEPKE